MRSRLRGEFTGGAACERGSITAEFVTVLFAVLGIVPGSPCDQARAVAAANRSELAACALDGLIATVQVETTIIGLRVVAHATAGPAPDPNLR